MRLSIDNRVFETYPMAEVGYVVASFEQESLDKAAIDDKISKLQQRMLDCGFTPGASVKQDPRIKIWRDIYAEMGVKPNDFPSSIESLCRRALNNKFPRILPIIDFYNACSVEALLPMGGYDITKITGDISLGFGSADDRFRGLGCVEYQRVEPQHIVYRDNSQVICWLWNHKDAADTCIDANTRRAIFFVDCAHCLLDGLEPMSDVIDSFKKDLCAIGAQVPITGVLSSGPDNASIHLDGLEELVESSQ